MISEQNEQTNRIQNKQTAHISSNELHKILISTQLKVQCTFESFALGDTNDIDHLVLDENITNWNGLFHVFARPVHLLRHGAAVQLNLHDVRLLLTTLHQTHLIQAQSHPMTISR